MYHQQFAQKKKKRTDEKLWNEENNVVIEKLHIPYLLLLFEIQFLTQYGSIEVF